MKFLYRKFLTALVFLFFAFNVKAVNDTLTIGQVFDLKVGDSLYYRPYEFFECHPASGATSTCYNYLPLKGFTVLSKQISSDTVNYVLQCLPSGSQDTVAINNLNSYITTYQGVLNNSTQHCSFLNIHGIDSFAINHSFNSGTELVGMKSNTLRIGYFESGIVITYLERVGIFSSVFSALEYIPGFPMGIPGGNGINLVYYKSDSTLWIDSSSFGYFYNSISEQKPSPTFHLFPNPATDELTITNENDAPVDVYIYDMLGNCVLTHKNFSVNMGSINVFFLPPGYYLLNLTERHGFSSAKGFIIAR